MIASRNSLNLPGDGIGPAPGSSTRAVGSWATGSSNHGRRDDRYPRILDMLDADDREMLLAHAAVKRVTKGQFLYHQGDASDALFIVISGTVKVVYINDEGNALTALYYREGMVVGAHGCTAWSGRHSWTAQALRFSRGTQSR